MDHHSLLLLRDAVKRFLDHMAAERIHTKAQSVAFDRISNRNNLLRGPVLEATLDKKVSKTIDHEWICLVYYGLYNLELLLGGSDFQLLLQKD